MLDVTRLRVFRAVVHAGSVQAAAANLGYSPSAVSQHITALQRETGLTLFERSGRGIIPTPVGQALADGSEEVMISLGRLDGLVGDLREGRTGRLSISTFPSAGQHWMPGVARVLTAEFPDLLLRLDLLDQIAGPASGYDLDLRAEDPRQPPTSVSGYRRIALVDEPYVLVVPVDHPLAAEGEVSLADAIGERLIAEGQQDAVCAQILRSAWGAAGAVPRYVAHTSDHHAAIALVEAGVGLTLLPRLAMGILPPGLVERPIAGEPVPTRRICVFVREDAAARAAVARAVELLRAIAVHGEVPGVVAGGASG